MTTTNSEQSTQTTPTAQLSAAGVSIWLDDLSRDRLQHRHAAEADRREERGGGDHQPQHLPGRHQQGRRLPRAGHRTGRPRRGRRHGPLRDHHRGRRRRLRPVRPGGQGHQRRGRPGFHRGGSPQGAGHTGHHRRGEAPARQGGPRQRVHQDPGHRGGPGGHHRHPGRGHQRQRDADLLAGALPRGDQRLPDRAGAGQGKRPRPLAHPLGGVVLRLPGGHRDRQAPGRNRHRGSQGAQGQGRPGQRPAGLPGLRGGLRLRALGSCWPTPARGRSGRCGPPPG